MALSWTSGLLEKFCMTSAGDRSTWAGGFGGLGASLFTDPRDRA